LGDDVSDRRRGARQGSTRHGSGGLTAAFVLRVRVEAPEPRIGPPHTHFRCEEVGTGRIWRCTDLNRLFEKLRARIDQLLRAQDA
jgi:hypothetical protein